MEIEVTIPEVGENVESIQVTKLLVKAGDTVSVDQSIVELETGKAIVEVPCPYAGRVLQLLIEPGTEASTGQPILKLERDAPPVGSDAPSAEGAVPPTEKVAPEPVPEEASAVVSSPVVPARKHVPASPSVRRLARELGVDVDTVKGSGPRGRVSREDVKRHSRDLLGGPGVQVTGVLPPLPDFAQWGSVRTEKMSAIRRQTAAHLALCWSAIPHVTIHDRADITALEPLRKKYADRANRLGGKLTMAVMVTKIVASALKQFPKLNASVDMANSSIIYKDYCHIGIAVATERGLVVPVIRDADAKNMTELAAEITQVAQKAREGRLKADEMRGGTFTVTNLGRIGGSYFTPIINYPEAAILGMGSYFEQSDPGTGEPCTFLPLSLSFDHRIVDGADGAAFLKWIIDAIHEPLLLALEG